MDQPSCPVPSCGADERGTANGSPPMFCRGYGSLDPHCMANWLSIDPEDAGAYSAYLAEVERGR